MRTPRLPNNAKIVGRETGNRCLCAGAIYAARGAYRSYVSQLTAGTNCKHDTKRAAKEYEKESQNAQKTRSIHIACVFACSLSLCSFWLLASVYGRRPHTSAHLGSDVLHNRRKRSEATECNKAFFAWPSFFSMFVVRRAESGGAAVSFGTLEPLLLLSLNIPPRKEKG